ncbi:hypothetical protein EV1_034624 [Malus domestica]|uniref:uncharacterized protein LOC126622652 n=1 Tax=Malus sylvestris TaxID=3752 RepID=UPI0007ECD44C|nr:uncharacterized protein LOC108173377 [Malus domestica]XP_050147365.1 uncharacterized protein LOC126622652 [Malus sylvestris]
MDKETDFIPTHFNLKFLAKFGDTTTVDKRFKHFFPKDFGSQQYLIEEAKPKESGSSNLQLLDDESEQDEEMEEIVPHAEEEIGLSYLDQKKSLGIHRNEKVTFDVIDSCEGTLHNLFSDGAIEMTMVPKEGGSLRVNKENSEVVEQVQIMAIEENKKLLKYSKSKSNEDACWGLEGINWCSISVIGVAWLERSFEEAEVQKAVFDCGRDKSPGLDGSFMQMFQSNWDILKVYILKVMEEFFEKGIINAVINETYICLILKKLDSVKLRDYKRS